MNIQGCIKQIIRFGKYDVKLIFPLKDTKFIWISSSAAPLKKKKKSFEKGSLLVLIRVQWKQLFFCLWILYWLGSWLAQINSPPYILSWQLNSDKVLQLTSDQIRMFWASMTWVPSLAQQSPVFSSPPAPPAYENDEKFFYFLKVRLEVVGGSDLNDLLGRRNPLN